MEAFMEYILDPEFLKPFGLSSIFIIFIVMLAVYIRSKDTTIKKMVDVVGKQNELIQANAHLNKAILAEIRYLKYAILNGFLKDAPPPPPPNDET